MADDDSVDTVTKVTSLSWLGRLAGAITGVLFGLVLFLVSFVLLFWNEGRAVETAKSLREGATVVVSIGSDRVDSANEGRLVHVTGEARTDEVLRDASFGIAANALKLERRVQMYQWEEQQESKTEKKLGGGTETVTTYSYRKVWSERSIDSSRFKEAQGHTNAGGMPFRDEHATARAVSLGAFVLSPALVGSLSDLEPLSVTEDAAAGVPAEVRGKLRVSGGEFYAGADPTSPQIGDVKVSFAVRKPGPVSVVAQQTGSTFAPYQTHAGRSIQIIKAGTLSAESMFKSAMAENRLLTWLLRVAGLVLMASGLGLMFRPLVIVADVVPFLGSILGVGVGGFAIVVALALSLVTIAVAWIVYRPLLGIGLLVAAIAILASVKYLVKGRAAERVPARPTARAPEQQRVAARAQSPTPGAAASPPLPPPQPTGANPSSFFRRPPPPPSRPS